MATGTHRLSSGMRRCKFVSRSRRQRKHQTGSPAPRRWLIAMPTAIVILLGALWSGFWYWSSSKAQASLTAWRAHEAEVGRHFDCANTAFGGFPFRIRLPAPAHGRGPQNPRSRSGAASAAVAQVWDPTLVIGEVGGPLTIAPLDGSPIAAVDSDSGAGEPRGVPGAPERLSVVLDNPNLTSVPDSGALAKAGHMEVHARLSGQSTPGHPALDLALDLKNFTVPGLVPVFGVSGLSPPRRPMRPPWRWSTGPATWRRNRLDCGCVESGKPVAESRSPTRGSPRAT